MVRYERPFKIKRVSGAWLHDAVSEPMTQSRKQERTYSRFVVLSEVSRITNSSDLARLGVESGVVKDRVTGILFAGYSDLNVDVDEGILISTLSTCPLLERGYSDWQ